MENANEFNYVFKVNLQCCKACPRRIQKKLMDIRDMKSVTIDMDEGLVKVISKSQIDPSTIVKSIAKIGKSAHLQPPPPPTPAPPSPAVSMNHGPPNISSGNSDGHHHRTNSINSGSGRFWSGGVHINEAATAVPPVALPHPNQLNHPGGGSSCTGRRNFWRQMSDPHPLPAERYNRWLEEPGMPPVDRYNRWPEPAPYHRQQQFPPPENGLWNPYSSSSEPPPPPYYYQQAPSQMGSAAGQYVLNDENINGCRIV